VSSPSILGRQTGIVHEVLSSACENCFWALLCRNLMVHMLFLMSPPIYIGWYGLFRDDLVNRVRLRVW
jgi:hypothetical protein